MKVGIYDSLGNAAYHASEGLSSTEIKQLARSPAHYRAYLQEPFGEQSAQQRLGSIVHPMLLEPDRVSKEIHVGDYSTRRGKDFDAAKSEAGDRLVCNRGEFDRAAAITNAIREQAITNPYFNGEKFKLLDGLKEHSFYCEDPDTGLLIKARPDNLNPQGVIVDLKTTSDASLDGFQKSIAQWGYHLSAAHYLKVVNELAGQLPAGFKPPTLFCFIVVETEAPYAVATYFLSADALELGDAECRLALSNYQDAVKTGNWSGYPKDMVEINLPGWYYSKANNNRGAK